MDGTLVDSEPKTLRAIDAVLADRALVAPGLSAVAVFGRSWSDIADQLKVIHPSLREIDVEAALVKQFRRICIADGVSLVPGSDLFFAEVAQRYPVGLFTSNVRSEVDALLGEHPVFQGLRAIVTAEDVEHAKPSPEGYLLLAEILTLNPARCVVFEDSVAGLTAARAAGMRTVGVTHGCPDASLLAPHADRLIQDYRALL